MAVHFTGNMVKFLQGLAKHNDREWFTARKAVYETELKVPMLAVIAELNTELLKFAPEHVRPPQKVMMRIYRDIRFSKNKAPYKTQVSAWWGRQDAVKTAGAGFYLSVSAREVTVAAGVFAPDKAQLLAIRRHLAEHAAAFQKLTNGKKMRELLGTPEEDAMTRLPKGFNEAGLSGEATRLIKQRRWGVSAQLPVEAALGSSLTTEVARRFRAAAPLVALLNEPLQRRERKPVF